MKKILTTIISSLFLMTISAKADIGIGISGAMHMIEGSGSETTRQSNQVNNGDHDETAEVLEIFVEAIDESGLAFGLAYIPTRDMGSKSRTDSNSEGDSGTYTAKAELDNVFKLYADIPTGNQLLGGDVYVHLGVQHVTVSTLESLNSGETYQNKD